MRFRLSGAFTVISNFELPSYQLPKQYTGEAEKLVKRLRDAENVDSVRREFSIFGASAVLLWADDEMKRLTKDVDVDGDSPNDTLVRFQRSSIENFLIHPDWRADRMLTSDDLGLTKWQVYLVHPIDLVILKLGRWLDRDYLDAALLVRHFRIPPETVLERMDEAWKYYATNNAKNRSDINWGFRDLFDSSLPDDALKVINPEDLVLTDS